MNAIIRLSLCAAAIAVATAVAAGDPLPPTTGKVLLIDYDRLLEGNIERVGDRFRIHQGAGEMIVPATTGMILLPSKDAAFQMVKSRTKLSDPIALVRLSRWCLSNELKQRALETAEMALALMPEDRSLKRFRDDVKLQVSLTLPPPAAPAIEIKEPSPPEPAVADVNPESFGLFATRVQPLLINACANCHGSGRGGNFRLTRPSSAFGDHRITQINLAAVAPFLNHEQPMASPLLTRAVTAHGSGALAPIANRKTPAFKYLEEWVRQACANDTLPTRPSAAQTADAAADPAPEPSPPARPMITGKPATPPPVVLPDMGTAAPLPAVPVQAAERKPSKPKAVEAPPAKKEPVDPFDPEIFNQMNDKPMK